jgi:hypothetical protein
MKHVLPLDELNLVDSEKKLALDIFGISSFLKDLSRFAVVKTRFSVLFKIVSAIVYWARLSPGW